MEGYTERAFGVFHVALTPLYNLCNACLLYLIIIIIIHKLQTDVWNYRLLGYIFALKIQIMKYNVKYIAYYRVSTQQQGQSGLGLDAQRNAVLSYMQNRPLEAEYTDIECGKSNTRVQLLRAIQHAKNADATLLIAKLDRLSRNIHFITSLQESKVRFICCDMPDANELTIHIFAALAQWEGERISKRTQEALKAKVARDSTTGWIDKNGKLRHRLGNPYNLTPEAMAKGVAAIKLKAKNNMNNQRAIAMIELLRKGGATLKECADKLNSLGMKTSLEKEFKAEQVRRLAKQNI